MPPNVIARIQMNADILHMVNASPNSFDFVRAMNLVHPVNIDKLSISFVGANGKEVDFQGVEHSLLLRIDTDR
jgi:transcription antitermination factor NusG